MRRRSGLEPLEPVLRHVEEELSDNLERACEKVNVREENTAELERLGDTLDAAARQARAAAMLRRRIRASGVSERLRERLATPPQAQAGADAPEVREAPPAPRDEPPADRPPTDPSG